MQSKMFTGNHVYQGLLRNYLIFFFLLIPQFKINYKHLLFIYLFNRVLMEDLLYLRQRQPRQQRRHQVQQCREKRIFHRPVYHSITDQSVWLAVLVLYQCR